MFLYRTPTAQSTINKCIDLDTLCNTNKDCPRYGDDELETLCKGLTMGDIYCEPTRLGGGSEAAYVVCKLEDILKRWMWDGITNTAPHFSLANSSIHPPISDLLRKTVPVREESPLIDYSHHHARSVEFHCHGGIPIHLLRNESALSLNGIEERCLCPPTLYGVRCEYQNQRVAVTLQIGTVEWQTSFIFIAFLLDNTNQIVQSYHQIRYVSRRDCNTKFSFHLLYSSRPKTLDRTYSVRIDAFEIMTLKHRGSWLFVLVHSFLAVYRLSILLTVPIQPLLRESRCPLKCEPSHGHCTMYANTGNFFCRCQSGWSGPSCTDAYECNCSPDSICVGSWNNRSICVCPLRKFGPRCYLRDTLCQNRKPKCQNSGQCVERDHRITSDLATVCTCPNGFRGTECQTIESRIEISFTSLPNHEIPESILLHFITVRSHPSHNFALQATEWGPHERATTFKKIHFDRLSITLYWGFPFHLLFAEYDRKMYLIMMQTTYIASKEFNVSIEANQRCPSIDEVLNSTIVSFPPLRRVKYYHLVCRQRPDLTCFHDEDQFICLCTYDRRANCFAFDHRMKYSCRYVSYCENGGQCFQDNATCPTAVMCACPKCFFGTRCHLSTKGFGLSLDVILGYQIRPKIAFNRQPLTLRVSGIVTIFMLIIGLVNGSLSTLTFQRKSPREVGCGVYLLIASIVSLLTMTIFTLKYVLLVLTQLEFIMNRSILFAQCVSVDFLLKIFLQTGDWLYACVAIERLLSLVKGINFKKELSKRMAKWIVLLLFIIGTSIHEPYHRTLVDDEDEQRIWCIVRYSESYSATLTTYTSMMSIIHFICPFVINIVSALGIIFLAARHRSNAQKHLSYSIHLRNQLRLHKYLIISPIVLVILALPRLILAFTLECMKSARDPVQLFLLAYFISFVPPLLTLVVFIFPSRVYRKELKASIDSLRPWLHCHKPN